MKIKTSITLSQDLLQSMDAMLTGAGNRSRFIEAAVRAYIKHLKKEARDDRELLILNQNADSLNQEAEDVLSFQVNL